MSGVDRRDDQAPTLLRLGTRASRLALAQSGHVADALRALGHDVELVPIRSEGDVTAGSLIDAGGLGLFATALRRAVLDGSVDFAVHSFKDLPTAPVPELVVAAVPVRQTSSDALCARNGLTLAELPPGSRVGTGSPRRAAQLRARRPDLVVVEIRGNVETRLARVHGDTRLRRAPASLLVRPSRLSGVEERGDEPTRLKREPASSLARPSRLSGVEERGDEPTASDVRSGADLDAVVLAEAGLVRLGCPDIITEILDLLPAPGQGALAVECRADDSATRAALAALDDPDTRSAVTAERAIPAALGAGCAAPLGVRGTVAAGRIKLTASVLAADGKTAVTVTATSEPDADADAFGRCVADELLARGAATVTSLGASHINAAQSARQELAPGRSPQSGDPRGLVNPQSARSQEQAPGRSSLSSVRGNQLQDFHDEQSLWSAATEPALVGRHILLPRPDGALAAALRAAGAEVDAVPLTYTRVLPFTLDDLCSSLRSSTPLNRRGLRRLRAGTRLNRVPRSKKKHDWLVLTSPTAVRVLVDAGIDLESLASRIAVVGASTAAAVRATGSEVAVVPGESSPYTWWAARTRLRRAPARKRLRPSRLSGVEERSEHFDSDALLAALRRAGQGASDDTTSSPRSSTPLNRLVTRKRVGARLNRVGSSLRSSTPLNRLGLTRKRAGTRLNRVSAVLPGSALADSRLADGLRALGWDVDVVPTYTTETKAELPPEIGGWDAYDAVVITAGSIARAVVELLGQPECIVAFGASSAAAARKLGLRPAAVAATQDAPGLIAALVKALG